MTERDNAGVLTIVFCGLGIIALIVWVNLR